ncbi:hypothetical protein GGR53DRAFT_325300 [Hypoxylon sp. FL1150]|nr:hypothetical protein GGR53DRAFT_325300 [Hypoxylon sp. FL1150]
MMYTNTLVLAALTAGARAHISALLPRETTAALDSTATVTSMSPECLSRIQSWSGAVPTPAAALQDALEDNAAGGLAESGLSGLCDFGASLPSAQASAFTSYNLGMYSYLSAQSSNLVALAATCSDDMGAPSQVITSQLDELLTVYSSFSAGGCKAQVSATTTADSTATATGSAAGKTTAASASATLKVGAAGETSSSGAASSTLVTSTGTGNAAASASDAASSVVSSATATPTQNAGARETGMHAMAALAAGIIGVAMAM